MVHGRGTMRRWDRVLRQSATAPSMKPLHMREPPQPLLCGPLNRYRGPPRARPFLSMLARRRKPRHTTVQRCNVPLRWPNATPMPRPRGRILVACAEEGCEGTAHNAISRGSRAPIRRVRRLLLPADPATRCDIGVPFRLGCCQGSSASLPCSAEGCATRHAPIHGTSGRFSEVAGNIP